MGKTAKCDRTSKEIPLRDGFFVGSPLTGEWAFTCEEAPEGRADYNIPVSDLTRSPESLVDWLGQLAEKTWFDPKRFFAFLERFRTDNDL